MRPLSDLYASIATGEWSLFLDRDGVINKRISGGYVTAINEFEWSEGAVDAIVSFNRVFHTIVVITNQAGVAKGLMSEEDLAIIHNYLLETVKSRGGKIHGIFSCTDGYDVPDNCRKPAPAMGLKAKELIPRIIFDKTIMIGDTASDMVFGRTLGCTTVFIRNELNKEDTPDPSLVDFTYATLQEFANFLQKVPQAAKDSGEKAIKADTKN